MASTLRNPERATTTVLKDNKVTRVPFTQKRLLDVKDEQGRTILQTGLYQNPSVPPHIYGPSHKRKY